MKNNSLSYSIARVVSTLFVPPTFTVFIFVYLSFFIEDNFTNQVFIILNSLVFGVALPVLVFVRMRKANKISDIDASVKNERDAPYLLNSIFCLTAIPQLIILKVDLFFTLIWIIFFVSTVILYFINKKWKISAHLIAASIAMGALTFIEGNIPIYLLILAFLIGWARIELKVHTLSQVVAGSIMGLVVSYFSLEIFYNFL